MKLCYFGKDGGPESTVWGFWPIEIKSLFSVALLCFENGSREAYHNHAFNSISWVLSGELTERVLVRILPGDNTPKDYTTAVYTYSPGLKPIITKRDRFHQVSSKGRSWVLTFRGPWRNKWNEWLPITGRLLTLTHGRKQV